MTPFDLEAAKRGDPICLTEGGKPYPVRFIGTMSNGNIAIEDEGKPSQCSARMLFMMPKRRTVYVNIYASKAGESNAWHHDSEEIARSRARTTGRIALAVAVPIEIED